MARYEHLPIYRAAFDLAVHFEKIVRNFSRYHKYTLGTELRDGSRRVLQRIIEANEARDARDREPALEALRREIEHLKVTARLAQESRPHWRETPPEHRTARMTTSSPDELDSPGRS